MAILNTGIVAPTGGYQIERSLRFNSADSAYLNRTFGSGGSRTTSTLSVWVKRSAIGVNHAIISCGSYSTDLFQFFFEDATNSLRIQNFPNSTTANVDLLTSAVYRDLSAWYHIVVVMDTTQATSSNRVKLYVNGSQVTAFSTATYPAQNATPNWNTGSLAHLIGARSAGVLQYSGYMTEINFIDGQALTPSDFGETDSATGVWKPKKFSGTYGTNGFYLNFSDNSNTTSTTLGKDSSGNGNNWTPNNFSVTAGVGNDSLVDTPTSYGTDTGAGGEVRGNYCTLNPLTSLSGRTSLSNGNLQPLGTSSGESGCDYGTIGVSSGKWYWECTVLAVSSASTYPNFGAVRILYGPSNGKYIGDSFTGGTGIFTDGNVYKESSLVTTVSSYTTNDVIGIALDVDNLTCAFYKNGTLLTTVTGLTAGTYWPGIASYYNSSAALNTGQRPFAYTAPSGFKAPCTQNLPPVTIGATSTTQAGKYMNVALYTGNGGTAQNITGVGFQPDWVWIKSRNSASFSHRLYDAVRGAGKEIYSNDTAAESNVAQSLTAFISDGFSLGTDLNNNQTSTTYVAWNWKANGAGSSNTAGSITSTVSANTTSGFSIVTYTGNATSGATVGHGLGVEPSMIIIKNRTDSASAFWCVYHKSAYVSGADPNVLYLNSTAAQADDTNVWSTSPAFTSTTFKLGDYNGSNGSGDSLVAYCFAPVAGYSAFGSYTGNGSSDGPFVYLGFRPRWVMIKASSTGGAGYDWFIYDTARDTYNVCTKDLEANLSSAEDGYSADIDVTANGFKLRNGNGGTNGSSVTYIYMAFAENPFKYSLAR